jgi:D-isomer specific 2-hydroxyacid dehydrogenase, catalytic domain
VAEPLGDAGMARSLHHASLLQRRRSGCRICSLPFFFSIVLQRSIPTKAWSLQHQPCCSASLTFDSCSNRPGSAPCIWQCHDQRWHVAGRAEVLDWAVRRAHHPLSVQGKQRHVPGQDASWHQNACYPSCGSSTHQHSTSDTQVTREIFEAAGGRLKVVGRAGVGVDNVDLTAATEVAPHKWMPVHLGSMPQCCMPC